MARYIWSRILSGIVTIYLVATCTFFAMHAVPGDPLMKGKAVSPEVRRNIEAYYGLDKPLLEQYALFLKKLLHGDFGISFAQENRLVNDIIRDHFPISATLGLLAVSIAAIGGVLFGTFAALGRNRFSDRTIMFFVILCVSVPAFVFGALGQYIVSELNNKYGVEVLPVAGWGTVWHMILPALVLGLSSMAFITRLMRSSLLEVVSQDYIRTAKAKGLSNARIFFQHQLRNSILPVLTYLGPTFAAITTGGFVAETIFSIPGLGRYFVQAVQQLDYTVILGLTIFYGSFLIVMVLLVDIGYAAIDPRIRVNGARR